MDETLQEHEMWNGRDLIIRLEDFNLQEEQSESTDTPAAAS